ncbi:MAG: hypothetical protein IKF38_01780 [Clostridia bacterium]|nr:hypothetical protein [Clostridia bacterium]
MGKIRMFICDTDGREIEPHELFGKKVSAVKKAMVSIMKYGRGDEKRYEGCYKAPDILRLKYEECCPDGNISYDEWKMQFYPEECELERLSCFNRDQQIVKCFKLVYGVAHKNGIHLEWQGKINSKESEPAWWTVSRGDSVIGYIQLI